MEIDTITEKKENGIFYTPPVLAEYLVKAFSGLQNISVLDPAYGEGSLLLAAEKILVDKNKKKANLSLFGCDTKPVNGLLKHLPEANLKKTDFFDFSTTNKFDVILMNPPYVRHHYLDSVILDKYKKTHSKLNILNNSADLWAYFIIKAVEHMKPNGSIAAILPWSFLQADYSQPLRKYLAENFNDIKLLSLSERYFVGTDERVVLIWLKDYGSKARKIQISTVNNLKEKIEYVKLPLENWVSKKVLYNGDISTDEIINTLVTKFNFLRLEECADVKIGVVTGANKYFIKTSTELRNYSFQKRNLKPILTSARELSDYISNKNKNLKKLIYLQKMDYIKFGAFVRDGVRKEINLRAHSQEREPWYQVKLGKTSHAFFPYRMAKYPFLVLNEAKTLCTNSIHRIYFKKLSEIEVKWVQISLLSIFGQLSLEINSKTYGRGVLKIEPSSLKRALVIKSNNPSINKIYPAILKKLSKNQKKAAVDLATNFLGKELNIPESILKQSQNAVTSFQNVRLSSEKVKNKKKSASKGVVK